MPGCEARVHPGSICEALPSAHRGERSLRSVRLPMEPLPEPAPRPGTRWLLLLPLLLLPPAPELGPSQARADETDWVRLPSKCEGEGRGPRGAPRAGPGLRELGGGRSWLLSGTPGHRAARERVSVHRELTDP